MESATTYKVYCDESRQTGHKYMLLGGVWIRQDKGWDFVNDFEDFCCSKLGFKTPVGHMKWTKEPTKPTERYYEAYKKLVDLYFEYNRQGVMYYRTIVVDASKYDPCHKIFYNGDYEKGFYTLYQQLLLNWIGKDKEYHIRIATRNIKKISEADCENIRLTQLKNSLNNKLRKRLHNYNIEPVKTIESRQASERRLIQIVDILTGAVGFFWNGEHLSQNVRLGKLYLAKHIANKLGKEDLIFETSWDNTTFNIFYLDLSKSKYAQN